MSFVAGTTTIPIAAGLVTAVALFLAWSVYAVRSERAEVVEPVTRATTATASTVSAPVQVVVRPRYSVAAPDADAVRAAMAHRISAPLAFPTAGRHGQPAAPQSLPRSA
jgi:hypothetical protein